MNMTDSFDLAIEEALKDYPDFGTCDDFCKAFGLTKAALYQLNHKGLAPQHLKIGRSVRYPRTSVIEWAKARKVTR